MKIKILFFYLLCVFNIFLITCVPSVNGGSGSSNGDSGSSGGVVEKPSFPVVEWEIPDTTFIFYVRDGASGGDGSNWANAYSELPADLVRNALYYIADGTYSGYTFDDVEDGNKHIIIKKATVSDHGTNTGWNNDYGDGIAQFTGTLKFENSYYVIDGQTGGGPGSWDSGHGIKILGTASNQKLIDLRGPNWGDPPLPGYILFQHMELEHRGRTTNTADDGIYTVSTGGDRTGNTNIIVRYSALHDFGRIPVNTVECTNWLFEYNYVTRNTSTSVQHAEGWQDFGSDDMVIRYNFFEDIEGTAFIALKKDLMDTNENWYVYGNIFTHGPDNEIISDPYSMGHGVFDSTGSESTPTNYVYFYNNTIIHVSGYRSGVLIEFGKNNKVFNNIWYNCYNYTLADPPGGNLYLFGEDLEYGYNLYIDCIKPKSSPSTGDIVSSGDPFVDWENRDFRLLNPTEAGVGLENVYLKDMYGNIHGSDGNWDRGAVEF